MSAVKKVHEMTTESRLSASLKKVKAQAAAAAPSLIPGKEELPPPPEKEPDEIPDIKEFIEDAKVRLKLSRLVKEDVEWADKEREAKRHRKPLISQIKKIMGDFSVGKAIVADCTANYFAVDKEGLSMKVPEAKAYLMSCGLTTAQINKLFKQSTSYTLRIVPAGQEEGEEE